MNCRGTDKILAIYWFLILVLVAGGIFLMVYTFYHHPVDVREVEAELLATKIADCLSHEGKLNSEVLKQKSGSSNAGYELDDNFRNNFLEKCYITFEVEDEHGWTKESEYFASVEFFDIGGISLGLIEEGNSGLKVSWEERDKKGKEFQRIPKHSREGLYVVGNGGQYFIQIWTIVKKTEKNVK